MFAILLLLQLFPKSVGILKTENTLVQLIRTQASTPAVLCHVFLLFYTHFFFLAAFLAGNVLAERAAYRNELRVELS